MSKPSIAMRGRMLAKQVLELPLINPLLLRIGEELPPGPTLARVPVRLPEVSATIDGSAFVMLDPGRCCVARELHWGRGAPIRRGDLVALRVFRALALEARAVLDIGANTGLFSLLAAKANPSARVHAFEIVPVVFEQLVRNVLRNDLARTIEPHLLGVGGPDDAIRVPAGSFGTSLPLSVSLLDRYPEGVSIPVRSLDQLSESLDLRGPLLIKIDVEGAERTLFAHAEALFDRCAPDVVCEILRDSDAAETLVPFLSRRGYGAYLFEEFGLRHYSAIRPQDFYRDWLLTPRSPEALQALLSPLGLSLLPAAG